MEHLLPLNQSSYKMGIDLAKTIIIATYLDKYHKYMFDIYLSGLFYICLGAS